MKCKVFERKKSIVSLRLKEIIQFYLFVEDDDTSVQYRGFRKKIRLPVGRVESIFTRFNSCEFWFPDVGSYPVEDLDEFQIHDGVHVSYKEL